MTDVELLVREALARHQAEVPMPDPLDARPVAVRARRRQVLNALGAGLLAIVIVLGAVSGVGAILRADDRTPALPKPSPPAASTRVGFLGLPPEGAQPSLPKVGRLMIGFQIADDSGYGHVKSIYVYADGRFVWEKVGCDARPRLCEPVDVPEGASDLSTGWLEQRLTPEGVQLVRSEILATGLFEGDLQLKVGKNFSDFSASSFTVQVRGPNGLIFLGASRSTSASLAPATPAQFEKLRRLRELFVDLERWLPADAWEDREIKGFVASCYLAYFSLGTRPPDPSELPPPANELLERRRSQLVTTKEAQEITVAFWGAPALDGTLAPPRREQSLVFDLEGRFQALLLNPVLPHQARC
jgi:hypothetical protein